ncbi:hypothetical protein GGS23DRAFT_553579 [Durotheca rogersii]|uniref:uncharacterized protein n=1 Tax=Durotheca rogersii TaxID=419775 RepID=UPI0022205FC5|nr:uncharacterized protein GGS23DRAFT_553579 [Durotheca rogersii]KAI5867106.1 hypothetical protein GGS23DRAFT_553579 [Durotheca rogersii]
MCLCRYAVFCLPACLPTLTSKCIPTDGLCSVHAYLHTQRACHGCEQEACAQGEEGSHIPPICQQCANVPSRARLGEAVRLAR